MRSRRSRTLWNVMVIAVSVVLLVVVDITARRSRMVPALASGAGLEVRQVDTQEDVYRLLRRMGAWGIRVVHLNRRFNLVEYTLPSELNRSRPFPIEPFDIRTVMEKGLNSDNWLFVATRTGMVRQVTWVLPDDILNDVAPLFASEASYSLKGGLVRGYTYDLYRVISRLDTVPRYEEPLVVTVDAAFFGTGTSPARVSDILRERFPAMALLVAVYSVDEPDVTGDMRRSLDRLLESFASGRALGSDPKR